MNISSGLFTIRAGGNESMTPAQYGYWAVRWAHDNATGTLNDLLKNKKHSDFNFVRAIRQTQFPAYLQFLALYVAAYWVYAASFLGVQVATINEMAQGMNDGLKDLRNSKEAAYGEEIINIFKMSFGAYYKSMRMDSSDVSEADPMAVNLSINNVTKSALHNFAQFYPSLNVSGIDTQSDAQIEIDRLFFSNFIADIPTSLFLSLKDKIGLTFRVL
jgi:hypothetical protein